MKGSEKELIPPYLCARCGTCVGICPRSLISEDEDGFPLVQRVEECVSCNLCKRCCPGKEVDFSPPFKEEVGGLRYDKSIGYYQDLLAAHSLDEGIREGAGSGGVITSILKESFRVGLIDGCLVVTMDTDNPLQAKGIVASDIEEILSATQSKYQPVGLNKQLNKLKDFKKIVVVGLPCHIHGLRRAEDLLPSLKEKIVLRVGLFCGFNMEKEATTFLIKKFGLYNESIKSIEYRAGKWPGGFKVTLEKGGHKFLEKEKYSLLNYLFLPERCIYCIDYSNELADLSVGDAWFMDKEKGGWSSVIVRNERGAKFFESTPLQRRKITLEDVTGPQKFIIDFKKRGAPLRIKMIEGEKPVYHYSSESNNDNSFVNKEKRFMKFYKNRKTILKAFSLLPFSLFTLSSQYIRDKKYRNKDGLS